MRPGLPNEFAARLVADCPDAIIYADAQGRIRFWNDAATRIFGFAAREAQGESLDLIIPDRLRARHWQGYEHVMQGGASRYGAGDLLSVPARHKDGRQISVEFTIVPLRDESGAMLGIAAFLRDVTPRFEEVRALRRELAAIEGAGPGGVARRWPDDRTGCGRPADSASVAGTCLLKPERAKCFTRRLCIPRQ